MSLIKDIYSPAFYNHFAGIMLQVVPSFDPERFVKLIFNNDFKNMEWKERMKHTTKVFHEFLPADFAEAVQVIDQLIVKLRENKTGDSSLAYIFFADYIEVYGLDDFENSIKAMEIVTQFISCEFAVRPFILKYGDRMLAQMLKWSTHDNHHVRRFASEGSRPRLPWAMAIPALKKDPAPIIPILENLKADPSEFVRRSVANNLNDIAKGQPELVIAIAAKWKGISKETDGIIKHGCRTLLKQGHADILNHYGLESKNIHLTDLQVLTPKVKIGDSLEFSFTVMNTNSEAHTVRLEYGIYYRKANGLLSRKVFKISEKLYDTNSPVKVHRKQSFRIITTKKFYTGQHQVSIIINGEEKEIKPFEIID